MRASADSAMFELGYFTEHKELRRFISLDCVVDHSI